MRYLKLIVIALLLACVGRAAIPALATWEVRPATGSDTNGGGYVPGSSGTDMSQYNNKNATSCTQCFSSTNNLSTGDMVGNGTTTITSATANFTSALVGNIVYITGTGLTTGWYEVTGFTSSVILTIDRSPGTNAGTGVLNMGGALAHLTTALVATQSSAGSTVWFTGTDTETAVWAPTTGFGASNGTPFSVIGYGSSRGDGTRATWTTATNSTVLFQLGNNNPTGFLFKNIKFSNTAGTSANMFSTNGASVKAIQFQNCEMTGFTTAINASSNNGIDNLIIKDCEIHGNTSVGVNNVSTTYILDSYIHDNTSHGVLISGGAFGGAVVIKNSIIYKNGGSGIYTQDTQGLNTSGHLNMMLINDDISDNTGDGFKADASSNHIQLFYNNIFYNNGGYGIDNITNAPFYALGLNNAFGANTSGATLNFSGTVTNISLSGDPFVARASGNFALNSTAGAGAAARAAGYPGVLALGGTGYADIGALQHQDSGGGATMHSYPIIQ